MASFDEPTKTLQSALCYYVGTQGTTTFDTPILTITYKTTHTFTVTYKKNCIANDTTSKTAGTSEDITYTGMPITWIG